MNIKTILQNATLSTAALGLIFMPRTAAAADLTFYDTFGPSNCSFFCTTQELWKIDAQIGGNTKELSIGSPETGVIAADTADWVWSNATIFDWRLQWDNIDEIATFIISGENGQSETLIYDLAGISPVNGMQLTTFVREEDQKLAAGTSINLTLNSVNGESLVAPANANATNTENAADSQNLYIASDAFIDGFELGGTVSFDWSTFNPQETNANSRAFFQFEANYADLNFLDNYGLKGETVSTSNYTAYTEVPEPTSILGLLTLGSGGLLTKLTSSKKNLK
ncbi:choice-of-anchor W domain-containing protein [Dapis sp. BLCC M126]|uniref:choice-of-anchor W domain-containing protein n=1 Tax=Dapis sp. BLCC M126 TaxID=3400189 RepID=UPI003CF508FC